MSVPLEQVSWTLDNATQVVLLATSVQVELLIYLFSLVLLYRLIINKSY